jgi:hypothetical protein
MTSSLVTALESLRNREGEAWVTLRETEATAVLLRIEALEVELRKYEPTLPTALPAETPASRVFIEPDGTVTPIEHEHLAICAMAISHGKVPCDCRAVKTAAPRESEANRAVRSGYCEHGQWPNDCDRCRVVEKASGDRS